VLLPLSAPVSRFPKPPVNHELAIPDFPNISTSGKLPAVRLLYKKDKWRIAQGRETSGLVCFVAGQIIGGRKIKIISIGENYVRAEVV